MVRGAPTAVPSPSPGDRRRVAGIDIEAVLGGTWIAIRQVMPGFRVKMAFTPSKPLAGDEATAHAHFDLCLKHANKWLPQSQIDAHIYAMSRGGRA